MRDLDTWEKEKWPWMTPDQIECYLMLCDIMNGANHVFGIIRPSGKGIYINTRANLYFATFDFDQLTRAVVLAHDRMIRFEICPSAPGMLALFFHKRHSREGRINQRHPTIEASIERIRA